MIIFGSPLSPYVRKVIVLADEKGMEIDLRLIARSDPDPEFRAASPLGKMPALRDGDFVLSDSTAIAFYLDAVGPGPALIPADPKDRARVLWWDEFGDTELFGVVRLMFFNRIVSPLFMAVPGDESAALSGEAQLPPLLDYLEGEVPEPDGFFVGDRLTLADIAVACPLVNWLHLGGTLGDHPRTRAWLDTMLARPSFVPVVAKERRVIAKARERYAAR